MTYCYFCDARPKQPKYKNLMIFSIHVVLLVELKFDSWCTLILSLCFAIGPTFNSARKRLRTADCGLRTTDYGLRTTDCGLGINTD